VSGRDRIRPGDTAERGSSFPDRDTFDAIVAGLGDPEWRRRRRIGAAIATAVLLLGALTLRLVDRSSWPTVATFALSFAVGLPSGLSFTDRRLLHGRLCRRVA
jgi:hypothetical protein